MGAKVKRKAQPHEPLNFGDTSVWTTLSLSPNSVKLLTTSKVILHTETER